MIIVTMDGQRYAVLDLATTVVVEATALIAGHSYSLSCAVADLKSAKPDCEERPWLALKEAPRRPGR